ncbi:MAG: helix-turn-helix domain-containing protein [Bacteroidales bacterium]|nr:helix-turn-helix domain-containing protein [Bacteroidales bacterium]
MNKITALNSCAVSNAKSLSFDLLTSEEAELIDENSIEVKYKKGETICKFGTIAPHIIHLKKGLAKIYLEGLNNSLILKIIPPGKLIGLTSILDGNNVFPYSAQVYEDSVATLIDIKVFRTIITQNAKFAASVIDILCENSLQTFGRFFCLTHKQLYGRMADILLCLAERIFNLTEFDLNLSRKELAELTGMSTESVIRMLKKFKDDGIIEMKGKKLKIVDYEKLKKISDYG